MSHSFADTQGRRWTFEFNLLAAKRVRDQLGIDLLKAIDPDGGVLEQITGDVFVLFDVMACLLEDEFKQQGISAEEFGRSLDEDCCARAVKALVEALLDFFQKPKAAVMRTAFGKVWQATETHQQLAIEKAREQVTSTEFDRIVANAVQETIGRRCSS